MSDGTPRGVMRHHRTKCCNAPIMEQLFDPTTVEWVCVECYQAVNNDLAWLLPPKWTDMWTELFEIMQP